MICWEICKHISIPHRLNNVIALRLIKENNLNINIKRNGQL